MNALPEPAALHAECSHAPTRRHTPAPWLYEEIKTNQDHWFRILTQASSKVVSDKNYTEEDAAYIVRAVNAHEELLAVLRLAQRALTGPTSQSAKAINDMIDSAIAKAEGK